MLIGIDPFGDRPAGPGLQGQPAGPRQEDLHPLILQGTELAIQQPRGLHRALGHVGQIEDQDAHVAAEPHQLGGQLLDAAEIEHPLHVDDAHLIPMGRQDLQLPLAAPAARFALGALVGAADGGIHLVVLIEEAQSHPRRQLAADRHPPDTVAEAVEGW